MREYLYFHSPCFDGIVSAVVLVDYYRSRGRTDVHLVPVDYDLKRTWLAARLQEPASIVDFLYHPDARFWADHHATTFLTDAARSAFEARRPNAQRVYDRQAPSCAGLLQRYLRTEFDYCNLNLDELVRWADKIDSARYESVDEALSGEAPAMRLNAALSAVSDVKAYCVFLVRELAERSLAEVASSPKVTIPADQALRKQLHGIDLMRDAAHLTNDGIALFDVSDDAGAINRYAPYSVFPDARYSAGIIRGRHGVKITSMRNPWKDFECAPLGSLCEVLGGGGHQRVGSIVLPDSDRNKASDVLEQLVAGIRAFEADRSREDIKV